MDPSTGAVRSNGVSDYGARYLGYLRATLADGLRQTPDLRHHAVRISRSELERGVLYEHGRIQLLGWRKSERQTIRNEDELWPLTIALCPWVYVRRADHGREMTGIPEAIAPIVIWANLAKDGTLSILSTGSVPSRPMIPRELLEPTQGRVAIGTLQEADEAYTALGYPHGSWDSVIALSEELIGRVAGRRPRELSFEWYQKEADGLCVLQQPVSACIHVERLVDLMLQDRSSSWPLYEKLLAKGDDQPIKDSATLLAISRQHVGQMDSRYPLSASQREALLHYIGDLSHDAEVMAIDGPPGTGKTTLLLSVIATTWVRHALEGTEPPVMVVSSTNNQAVVNVLEAFARVREKADAQAGRWIADIESYGLYACAKGKEELLSDRAFPVHTISELGKQARHAAVKHETREGLEKITAEFLKRFEWAFGAQSESSIQSAQDCIHRELKRVATSISAAVSALQDLAKLIPLETIGERTLNDGAALLQRNQELAAIEQERSQQRQRDARVLRHTWTLHIAAEPWWVSLFARLGIQGPRTRRDATFCTGAELSNPELIGSALRSIRDRSGIEARVERILTDADEAQKGASQRLLESQSALANFSCAHQVLRDVVPAGTEITLSSVQEALDLGPRFDAFKLATHYWEARYILDVEGKVNGRVLPDSKSAEGLRRQYRRLSKLWPCFVSTLYMLPARFIGWRGADEPMYGAIDVLIVDEAGQAPPDVAIPSFSLAKRALVVGDVDQLAPIWNVGAGIDCSNARANGLVAEGDPQPGLCSMDEFQGCGLAASGGNLMRAAQRATRYEKYPERGRGLFLSEHRRCWKEIISICNDLAYHGLLKPMRDDPGERKLLPSVGYVHVPGYDERVGQSRKNMTEASAIAKWIRGRREEIEAAFAEDRKPFGKLIAVIAPFAAQARAIRAMLNSELGSQHGITVGTVHALQGAECRVVIFSPTYGSGTKPGSTFFDQDCSMLNVAVSRAQDAFLVFGNMDLFRPRGTHPAAVVGRSLFRHADDNELKDLPTSVLVPVIDLKETRLIRELQAHRQVLAEAFETARFRLVVVSPFLSKAAIEADGLLERVRKARDRNVRVKVVSDQALNEGLYTTFPDCVAALNRAGAEVQIAQSRGVHSKLILVDHSWLVVGSFNWLSAQRSEGARYMRYETSIRYDGPEAFQMISASLSDLSDVIRAGQPE